MTEPLTDLVHGDALWQTREELDARLPVIPREDRNLEPVTADVRRLVLERDGRRCRWCPARYRLEIDHVVPRSRGGGNASSNLRVLCDSCNRERGNAMRPHEFRPLTPVTLDCDACALAAGGFVPYEEDPVLAFCGICGVVGPTDPAVIL